MLIEETYRHRGMRHAMVKEIRSQGIKDTSVLKAMGDVPRHHFFDSAFLEHAYQNKAFGIGEGQTISQPYTVAYQTQLLRMTPNARVLEIGTGSGYQAAILAAMGGLVYSIEYNKILHKRAKQSLAGLPLANIHLYCGDGSEGLPRFAPYDRIIVTAGAPQVPEKLISQLQDGGTLVIPVGDADTQCMLRITKVNKEKIIEESFDMFRFVPLLGKSGWQNLG
ncbi:MAG: protein-L-isoaspartate(D-aspartate) O-methyltransferase [Bernardetiaceae bacterium]|nr:protein-L-isoaspartate(D-aspartate) O-methyltransferase [Bernardetiaceae bacterium]